VSRGMSHVSEMILATVSKVEGISKSLIGHAFRATAADVFAIAGRTPRTARLPRLRSVCPYSEEAAQVQWRENFRRLKALACFPTAQDDARGRRGAGLP
jgi:hypothetical protein